ncbi:hypothetical protein HJFPF1_13411 [Paramyrothecium foliicola]|nr:hypothetical protein HJFPF1_13411 [Paramyrothecium foliicola]
MAALTGADGTVAIPVYYQPLVDQQVVANISWGTPAQEPIPTVIDTGSYGYWVYGPNATVNSGSPYLGVLGPCNQTAEPFLNWPESSTHQGPYPKGATFAYGGGGKILDCPTAVNDTMNFAGYPSVPDAEVALCNFLLIKDRATTCDGAHYDKSILGLAPHDDSTGPFFREGLRERGLVEKSIYSFWFEKLPNNINDPQYGTLLLGGAPDDVHVGDIATVKQAVPGESGISGLYYVELPEVQAASINGTGSPQTIPANMPFSGAMPDCLVDTGTWGLTLPTDEDAFFEASGLEKDSPFVTPRYPAACANIPANATIDLKFTGEDGKVATIKIPYRNLAQHEGQVPNTCSLNLQLGDPGCTFGGTFFTAALSIFDDAEKTIGFAEIPL